MSYMNNYKSAGKYRSVDQSVVAAHLEMEAGKKGVFLQDVEILEVCDAQHATTHSLTTWAWFKKLGGRNQDHVFYQFTSATSREADFLRSLEVGKSYRIRQEKLWNGDWAWLSATELGAQL